MATVSIGVTFAKNHQWHTNEVDLIKSIRKQIDRRFPYTQNLLINTTWFGPQFDNNEYLRFETITSNKKFENLFLLSSVDPVMLNPDQIDVIYKKSGVANMYKLGNFDGELRFTFPLTLLPGYFKKYQPSEVRLQNIKHLFLNYNRKPRDHRVELVKALIKSDLSQDGIVTLGKMNETYCSFQGPIPCLTSHEPIDNDDGHQDVDDFGILNDIHTLGNMDLWNTHFLNVASETEFLPWNDMYISEKTWKPMIGMRPFVINGQTKIYKYLRDNGFRTFTHYFKNIDLENISEYQVHQSIISAIKFLKNLSHNQRWNLYQQMLPDLEHNRRRFYEFAAEQQYYINHLFD